MSAASKIVPIKQPGQLLRYDAMCNAITECHSVDEVIQLRAEAAAMATLYAEVANNSEPERQCNEIRRRAERRCGEVLADMEKDKGGRPPKATAPGNPFPEVRSSSQRSLDKMGISHKQSHEWQQLAWPWVGGALLGLGVAGLLAAPYYAPPAYYAPPPPYGYAYPPPYAYAPPPPAYGYYGYGWRPY